MNLITKNAIGTRTMVARAIMTLIDNIIINTPTRVITAVVS